jgi:site-specific DNA-methyltransferase (adenine-specific)
LTPYYEQDGITIYHGDCQDAVGGLFAFDLMLTDPPYGIGIASNPFRQKFERNTWDDAPVDDNLLTLVGGNSKWKIIWGGNYFNLPPSQGFFVWDKVQPENFSSAMVEMAWTNIKTPAKLYRRRVVGYEKFHPTQKPVELMGWCIGFSPEASTIFDPFMGAGTTLVAAKRLGRAAVGVELNEEYCEIAAKRLSQMELKLDFANAS